MICSQLDIRCYDKFHLTNFNTLKIDSIANSFYMPANTGELISVYKKYANSENKPIILGAGSNILFSSKGVENPIIYTGNINSHIFISNTLEAEAGIRVQTLAKLAYEKGLSGLEFLIGIPASLGGAMYMNAGAHGESVSDNLIRMKVYDTKNAKTLIFQKNDSDFSYRHSVLQDKNYILLSAKFKLARKERELIKSKMDENIIFRKNRQPNLSLPNAGSVFKNPENCEFSAGALIDKCGLRGFELGDCKVYENHCNFIVNKGSATSSDYTNIVFEIYSKVKEKFNVELIPEIIYVGKMTKDEEEKWKIMKKN